MARRPIVEPRASSHADRRRKAGQPADPRPAATCPACGEWRLVEFDPVLGHWHCAVCGWTWAVACKGMDGYVFF